MIAQDEAEQAARELEARFRAVFSGAAVGIGVGDVDGRILDVNPALQKMLGYTVEEMRQRNVGEFIHPADTAEVWQLYQQLVSGEVNSFRIAKRFVRSDGETAWTQLTVSLIRDADGRPEYQIAVMEDVTDLRRLQSRLEYQAHHDTLTGLANRAAVPAPPGGAARSRTGAADRAVPAGPGRLQGDQRQRGPRRR